MHHLYTSQDGLTRQLAELNRNLISQNNRMVAQFERLGERVTDLERAVNKPPVIGSGPYARATRHRLRRVVGRP